MSILTVECDTGNVSDGFHTFNELYDHRCHLFIALMISNPSISWRSIKHEDGTSFEGWFIAGMHLSTGDITYHLPIKMWGMLDKMEITTLQFGCKWDGHTASDVINRLAAWINK